MKIEPDTDLLLIYLDFPAWIRSPLSRSKASLEHRKRQHETGLSYLRSHSRDYPKGTT